MLKLMILLSLVLGWVLSSVLRRMSRNPSLSEKAAFRLYVLGYLSMPLGIVMAYIFAYFHGLSQR